MQTAIQTPQEVVRRGIAIYEQQLKPQVEIGNYGKFLVINTETGEYEMDADDVAAAKRAKTRFADAPLFSMRVGHAAAYRLGRRRIVKPPKILRPLDARRGAPGRRVFQCPD